MGYPFGPFYRLIMLTGQRRSEWSEARWSQVDYANRWLEIPIVTVARLAGDDEADKRHGKAQAAAAKQAEGAEITGFPRLIELLGLEKCAPKLRKWLGACETMPCRHKTVPPGAILVQGGDINRIIDQAEVALIAHGEPIYQRGGELVRAARLEVAQSDDGIQRRAGSTILLPVKAPWLVQAMATVRDLDEDGRERPHSRSIPPKNTPTASWAAPANGGFRSWLALPPRRPWTATAA